MKRKLTAREWMLLGVLVVLAVISSYVAFFYMPMTSARDAALAETQSCEEQNEALQLRLAEKQRMERELEEIFLRDAHPIGLPDYDNLQPVIIELNGVLASTENYSLSFATVDDSESVVRREIAISFTCGSYDAAKGVLQRLHDSLYRCMLNNVSISLGQDGSDPVSVSGSIVYFECHV